MVAHGDSVFDRSVLLECICVKKTKKMIKVWKNFRMQENTSERNVAAAIRNKNVFLNAIQIANTVLTIKIKHRNYKRF